MKEDAHIVRMTKLPDGRLGLSGGGSTDPAVTIAAKCFRVLDPVSPDETEERAVRGAMTEDGRHLVALRQVVARGPEALVEIRVVGVEPRVDVDALQIPAPLEKEIEQVLAPRPERHVEGRIPLELEPVAILQQKGRQRMLASLQGDLQRRLGPGSLGDGLWRQLKRLPVGDPALDVVEAAFAAQLVEGPDVLRG